MPNESRETYRCRAYASLTINMPECAGLVDCIVVEADTDAAAGIRLYPVEWSATRRRA